MTRLLFWFAILISMIIVAALYRQAVLPALSDVGHGLQCTVPSVEHSNQIFEFLPGNKVMEYSPWGGGNPPEIIDGVQITSATYAWKRNGTETTINRQTGEMNNVDVIGEKTFTWTGTCHAITFPEPKL
jgi:hypothetical protein